MPFQVKHGLASMAAFVQACSWSGRRCLGLASWISLGKAEGPLQEAGKWRKMEASRSADV